MNEAWRGFWSHGTNFIEHYACRGTSLIGASRLSTCRIFVRGTGAVSRYKLFRSQKSVTVQGLDCVQVSVSGFKMLNEFLWPAEHGMTIKDQKKKEHSGPYSTSAFCLAGLAGHQAKSVTNNLPILSVLALGIYLFFEPKALW